MFEIYFTEVYINKSLIFWSNIKGISLKSDSYYNKQSLYKKTDLESITFDIVMLS